MHEVPVAVATRIEPQAQGFSRELVRGSDLPTGTCPPWSELHVAMLHAYSQSYEAAGAYQDLHSLKRFPGPAGKVRVEEHSMFLRRKGVSNPGGTREAK